MDLSHPGACAEQGGGSALQDYPQPGQRRRRQGEVSSASTNDSRPVHEVVAFARHMHRTRLKANKILGAQILSDPRFEMLLELFVAHYEQRRVSITDLCAAAGAPTTTGLRHIDAL